MSETRFMAVDAGSNATKFRLWRLEQGREPGPIIWGRRPLRLGRSVFDHGRLDAAIMDKAEEVFLGLLELARNHGVQKIRAVGTSALRDAANAADLVGRISRSTGIRIEIITALEEARLIMEGVLAAPGVTQPDVAQYVLLDIGGGSTEVIVTREKMAPHLVSLPLGAVRLTDRFLLPLPPDQERLAQAERNVDTMLARELKLSATAGQRRLLGGGGTATTLVRMYTPSMAVPPPQPVELTLAQIDELVDEMASLTPAEIVERYGIEEDRADVTLGGALILRRMLAMLSAEGLAVVWSGVAEGLLQDHLYRRA